MFRHALYVASFEERPTVWLRPLQPLRQAGLVRIDVTGALAPDCFWDELPGGLHRLTSRRMLDASVPFLHRLHREVASAGLAGSVVTAGPGERGVLRAAELSSCDLVIVALPRVGEEVVAEPYLRQEGRLPILFTRDRMAAAAGQGVLVDGDALTRAELPA